MPFQFYMKRHKHDVILVEDAINFVATIPSFLS